MEKVLVRTTLPRQPYPLIADNARPDLTTARLILKPYTKDVWADLHAMRLQPDTMHFTKQGRVDRDMAETWEKIVNVIPPNDSKTFNWAVYERSSGNFVGVVGYWGALGILGWPEFGYMLRKEYWGKGIGTEVLAAWVEAWWKLEREEVEIEVAECSVKECSIGEDGFRVAGERVYAMIDAMNIGSRRVLEKNGFKEVGVHVEGDSRVGFEGKDVVLPMFVTVAPGKQ